MQWRRFEERDCNINKRKVGDFYEDSVCEYLKDKGITIIERNFRCKIGEIDIIGRDKDTLVFFEVKYRKNSDYGSALMAINVSKQNKIRKVAQYYLTYKNNEFYIRFDAVGITGNNIEWIKNAF